MHRLALFVLVVCFPSLLCAAQPRVGIVIEPPVEYYGPVDVRAVPDPWLVYPNPVLIEPVEGSEKAEPLYLYVPGDHHRRWFKHCRDYNACSVPVFFVKESWYKKVYRPAYYGDSGKSTARPAIVVPVY